MVGRFSFQSYVYALADQSDSHVIKLFVQKRDKHRPANIEGIYLYLSLGLYSDLQPLNYKSLKIFESLLFEKFLVVSN